MDLSGQPQMVPLEVRLLSNYFKIWRYISGALGKEGQHSLAREPPLARLPL